MAKDLHIPTPAFALNPAGAPATVDMCLPALSERISFVFDCFPFPECTRDSQKSLRKPLRDPHTLFFAKPPLRGARRVKERSDWKPADTGIDVFQSYRFLEWDGFGFFFSKKTR